MFPAVEPDDVRALTACIDYVLERAGVSARVLVREDVGEPGLALLREHFEVETGFDWTRRGAGRADRRVTTRS